MTEKTKLKGINIWWHAARPKTLWAAFAPVIIGTAMALEEELVHWPAAILAALGAILIQIGTNYANDYYDFLKGADEGERLGPTRVTQAGLVKPQTMRAATILIFALTLLVGIYLIYRGGWPILIIGLLSILFGILYTAGPFPLGYHGLGDIFVLIFFGPVAVGGTYYVQALSISNEVLLVGLAPGLYSTAILTVNNLRDIETDHVAGKRTLAVRFGKTFAKVEYLLSILIPVLIPAYLVMISSQRFAALITLLVMIPAIRPLKTIFQKKPGPVFNEALAQTGKLLLLYSLLFAVGWNL